MSRNFTPDETLIDQLLLDDTSAFEELHHRYCFSLYNYCISKLASPEDARRIVRDLFISLWETRHELPVNFSISMHLYTEVRKSVVACVNEKLNSPEDASLIGSKVIPSFSVEHLKQARMPVTHYRREQPVEHRAAMVHKPMDQQWWNRYPSALSGKKLIYAFQKVLHML
jgi:hypothetical protein